MKFKKLIFMFLTVSCAAAFSACGNGTEGTSAADTIKDAVNDVSTAAQSNGRDYGETIELAQTDVMESAFFNCTVNSAELVGEIDGYVPNDETYSFLRLNVTIENTFEDTAEIAMFYNDFELTWDGLDGSTVFPETQFAENQLPDEYSIFKNESRTGDIIFVIPTDAQNIKLKYIEFWDDDFEGNEYIMSVTDITK